MTWLYLRKTYKDATRAKALKGFVLWILGTGQEMAEPEGYTRLPPALAARVKTSLVAAR
jgi:ABC-type phosphate transport system substrate-binding protein